jgi:hypothetical protein
VPHPHPVSGSLKGPSGGDVHPFEGLPTRLAGLLYIYLLVKRGNVRAWFEKGTKVLLTVYIIVVGGEVGLELWGRSLGTNPLLWLRLLFWTLIGFALFTKLREWSDQHQERLFIGAARTIVELDADTDPAARASTETITQLLETFRRNFKLKQTLNANFAQFESGVLKVKYVSPPDADYDKELVLRPGEGGCGFSFQNQCVVYIPRRRLRHGIVQDIHKARPYLLKEDLYVNCSREPFNSILSVPVTAAGVHYGVLNLDSAKGNAFRRIDFEQAMFFGFVLAQFLRHASMAAGNQVGSPSS